MKFWFLVFSLSFTQQSTQEELLCQIGFLHQNKTVWCCMAQTHIECQKIHLFVFWFKKFHGNLILLKRGKNCFLYFLFITCYFNYMNTAQSF